MNLEKISLLLIIKYFRQFGGVKKHLTASFKELLLAVSSSIEIANQVSANNALLSKFEPFSRTLRRVDDLLQYGVIQLESLNPAPEPPKESQIRDHILESIIEVIDDECERIQNTNPRNARLKIEALETVKSVLCHNLELSADTANPDKTLALEASE